jgi:hypothetical protein
VARQGPRPKGGYDDDDGVPGLLFGRASGGKAKGVNYDKNDKMLRQPMHLFPMKPPAAAAADNNGWGHSLYFGHVLGSKAKGGDTRMTTTTTARVVICSFSATCQGPGPRWGAILKNLQQPTIMWIP